MCSTGEMSYRSLSLVLLLVFTVAFLAGYSTENGSLIISSSTFLAQTAWEDLRVPLSATRNPSSAPGYDAFKNGTKAWAFDKASDEMLYFETQIPHNYKLGTTLRAHIHWTPIDTNTGGVVWCLEYTIIDMEGTFGASTTDCARDPGDGVAYKYQIINIEDVAGTSTVSAVLVGRLFRDADSSEGKGTDDYDNDAVGLSFDIHYQIDSFGSRQETVK